MRKRIAISGVTGFVGRSFAQYLMSRDHEVLPLSRRLDKGHAYFDMNAPQADLSYLADCDVVVHCAAVIDQGNLSDLEMIRINAEGTRILFENARRFGVKKFINMSSGAVYGDGYDVPINESMVCNPQSAYGKGKLLAEDHCHEGGGMLISHLRLFFPFGAGQENRLVPNLAYRIKNGLPISLNQFGKPEINPIHIDSLLEYLMWFVEQDHSGVFNVAGNEVVSIEQLARMMNELLGNAPEYINLLFTEKQSSNMIADVSKLRSETSIDRMASLCEGLKKTLFK